MCVSRLHVCIMLACEFIQHRVYVCVLVRVSLSLIRWQVFFKRKSEWFECDHWAFIFDLDFDFLEFILFLNK